MLENLQTLYMQMNLSPLAIENLCYYIQISRFCFHTLYLLNFSCLFLVKDIGIEV